MSLIGQQKLLNDLQRAVREGHIAHAYLLCGGRGSGKKTLAAVMSEMFMCPNGGCGSCAVCTKVQNGVHPDVVFVTGEGKDGLIPVSQVRALRKDVYTLPNEGSRKIYIIDGAEKMNVMAQDAFLKVLEEPPEYTIFILLCADEGKMLQTVLSRVVKLPLAAVDESEGAAYITERLKVPQEQARAALKICDGRIGAAADLLQNGHLTEQTADCARFCRILLTGTAYDLAVFVHQKAADKQMYGKFLDLLVLYFRDILIYKKTGKKELLYFADSLTEDSFLRLREGGLVRIIEGITELKVLCAQPISLLLLETRLVTLCVQQLTR